MHGDKTVLEHFTKFTGKHLSEAAVRSVLQNKCSQKFRNILRKTPVLESLEIST